MHKNPRHAPASIAAIQLNSSEHLQDNLDAAYLQLELAANNGAECAVLPENFAWMGREADATSIAEPFKHGPVQDFLQQSAKHLKIWLIGGSHRILGEHSQKAYNSSLVYNPAGEFITRYDKIHLFDADVNDGQAYRESDSFQAGDHRSVFETDFANIGMTICYDLRFPGLYQALRNQGADVIVVPAAFTATTGEAHWKPLLRARAIENQVYIIAPAQCGTHIDGRKTWGHSLCISPWGEIIAELADEPGHILCSIDPQKIREIRQKMPVFHHRQPDHY